MECKIPNCRCKEVKIVPQEIGTNLVEQERDQLAEENAQLTDQLLQVGLIQHQILTELRELKSAFLEIKEIIEDLD